MVFLPLVRSAAKRSAAWVLACLALSACGVRTVLFGLGDETALDGGTETLDGSTVPPDASALDVATDSGAQDQGLADGTGDGASAPAWCVLASAGDPIVIGSFPDQHADAPSLAVIERGTPVGGSARVAFQAFRNGGSGGDHAIFAGTFGVAAPWPSGLTVTQPMTKVGTDSHGWAEMATAADGSRNVALAWYGDPGMVGRTMFRTIDADTWIAGNTVDLSFDGSSSLGLAAGAGVGDMGIGYAGFGYGAVWRQAHPELPDAPVSPVVAVLDTKGGVVSGPHPVAAAYPYPGMSPSIAWSGRAYLMATAFRECLPGDEMCVPNSIVITRVRPASGDSWDDSGVDQVASIAALDAAWYPGRATMASDGADTFVVWAEGPIDGDRTIRLARLDEEGHPRQEPVAVAQDVRLQQSPRVDVAPFGVFVVWPEEGLKMVGVNEPGRTRIAVTRLSQDLEQAPPVVRIDATQFGSYGWVTAAWIASPRSLLVAWPGYPTQGGLGVAWLAALECHDPPLIDGGVDAQADAQAGAEYFATVGPMGALDRILLAKRDTQRDLCFRIGLAHPMDSGPYSIAVSDPWAVESAVAVLGADKCVEPPWPEPVATCSEASGAISLTWQPGEWMPCSLDVDVTLKLDGTQPWAPWQEELKATGVAVAGACGQP